MLCQLLQIQQSDGKEANGGCNHRCSSCKFLTVRYKDHQNMNLSFALTSRCPCSGMAAQQTSADQAQASPMVAMQIADCIEKIAALDRHHYLFEALEPPVAALVCHLIPIPQPDQQPP
jgi:hypothetical protein